MQHDSFLADFLSTTGGSAPDLRITQWRLQRFTLQRFIEFCDRNSSRFIEWRSQFISDSSRFSPSNGRWRAALALTLAARCDVCKAAAPQRHKDALSQA